MEVVKFNKLKLLSEDHTVKQALRDDPHPRSVASYGLELKMVYAYNSFLRIANHTLQKCRIFLNQVYPKGSWYFRSLFCSHQPTEAPQSRCLVRACSPPLSSPQSILLFDGMYIYIYIYIKTAKTKSVKGK